MKLPCGAKDILVVEDDECIRETLAELLTEEGYRVVEASNGKEALTKLQRTERPCLILLDLMMPVMNGWAFRAAQRADPALASIPVVVLTGVADGQREASALDAAQCLLKPFEFDPLLEVVKTHCGNSR